MTTIGLAQNNRIFLTVCLTPLSCKAQVWINGNENLYYKGATEQFNEAIITFAKVAVKNHVVVLRPGPVHTSSFLDKTSIQYNWKLHVISGIALSRATDDIEDLERQKIQF